MNIPLKTVTLNDRSVAFRETEEIEGQRNILLLHGMSFSSSDWQKNDLMERISKLGFNVTAVDYPGFGSSERNAGYSFEGGNGEKSAAFVRDFADSLQRKFYCIVGPSMGGYIALETLIRYPGLFEKAVLVAAAGLNSLRERLHEISAGVLIIWGTNDSIISRENVTEMNSLLVKSRLATIEGAGHAAYLDNWAEFLKLLDGFLSEP